MGGGFGWQLDGLLISQSNQKMSMKEAGGKNQYSENGFAVCSAKAQKFIVKPRDSLETHFNMFLAW